MFSLVYCHLKFIYTKVTQCHMKPKKFPFLGVNQDVDLLETHRTEKVLMVPLFQTF